MSKAKGIEIKFEELQEGQIVWSEHFNCYVKYAGQDLDKDYCFKYLHKTGYCIIYSSKIFEPPSLIKELL